VTVPRQARAVTAIVALVVAVVVLPSGSASANQFTVHVSPSAAWCNPGSNGPFLVSRSSSDFSFKCDPSFEVSGDPAGSTSTGYAIDAWVNAPTGITITGASSIGSAFNLNNGSGWVGGSFFSGGGTSWPYGATSMTDPSFASPYWGAMVECVSTCTGAGRLYLNSITLTASEATGPILTPTGSDNLWFQTRRGEWIWNPPGDAWPLTLVGSDPSGVCRMSVDVGNHAISGPSAIPQTGLWQQCPDPTWTPAGGASVDTRGYLPDAGSLPLTINATNAAGVITSYSETLHVDNDPVSVLLSTSNDASRTVWSNHAVTVFATPNTGPSGVGGTNCSVGSGTAQPYTPRGVTVDGNGIHAVSCTAWNNAVGPQGQPNSTTSSTAVDIDEVPPSVTFEPRRAGDPTGLTLDATDSESGVAGGSIQMAPAGTTNWVGVPTSYDGAHLLAHVDDAGLHGPYDVRATSCDNVGNCAETTERLTLPLRAASDSEVSLTRIVSPARRQVVIKQVRVGWHWATVRRGNQLVRVKRGGHLKTIKIIRYVETCTSKRVKTGPDTWRIKRRCAPPGVRLTSTLRVPYGHDVTIHGLYTTSQGVPLGSQPVRILAAADNQSNAFAQLATATTASDGSWSATIPPGPSRIIRAVTDGTATILPSSGQVTTVVPAMIKLVRVWPRRVAWGGTVHLVGQLFGGYLPKGGALVRLRIGYGSTFNTYGVEEHVSGTGRFSTVASFGPGDPTVFRTYWFQIASLPMGNYPFAPAASQRVPVTVGGHPGTG
jgi:hypothetical protein